MIRGTRRAVRWESRREDEACANARRAANRPANSPPVHAKRVMCNHLRGTESQGLEP